MRQQRRWRSWSGSAFSTATPSEDLGRPARSATLHLLLDAYTAAVALLNAKAPVVFLHRLWDDSLTALRTDVAPALRESGVGWALTGGAASMLLAPYLSSISTIELYVATALFEDRGCWPRRSERSSSVASGSRSASSRTASPRRPDQ